MAGSRRLQFWVCNSASAILRPYRSANLDRLDLRSDQMEAWHDAVVLHGHDETPLPQHERGRPRRKCNVVRRAGAGRDVSQMGDLRSRNAAARPRQLQEGDMRNAEPTG